MEAAWTDGCENWNGRLRRETRTPQHSGSVLSGERKRRRFPSKGSGL